MNAKKWRQSGYKTIFRHGLVFLFRRASGIIIYTRVDAGRWTLYDNVNRKPWICTHECRAAGFPPLRAISDACYCDEGCDLCDFCAGTRKVQAELPATALAQEATDGP